MRVHLFAKALPTTILSIDGELLSKANAKIPYAILEDVTWNEGTDAAKKLPTLSMLYLPKKMRGKGLALSLLDQVVLYMKRQGIKYLAFDNYADDFWKSALRQRPNNVELSKPYRGTSRFGFVKVSKSVRTVGLL